MLPVYESLTIHKTKKLRTVAGLPSSGLMYSAHGIPQLEDFRASLKLGLWLQVTHARFIEVVYM